MTAQAVGTDKGSGIGGESQRCRIISDGFVPQVVKTGPRLIEKFGGYVVSDRHVAFDASKLLVIRGLPGRSDIDHAVTARTDSWTRRQMVKVNQEGHGNRTGNGNKDKKYTPLHEKTNTTVGRKGATSLTTASPSKQ
jgi:hypothetical protein